jgi:hypothetical protein
VRDQGSVSIIARDTIALNVAEQASASIVANAAGARTALLRPPADPHSLHHFPERGQLGSAAGPCSQL